ncbi:MAG TPA: EVE domain-containing protein [Candidatus Acidoferrales bacterium]|nr:EVE domain-containing protein [Candidatus Acidoferrales bacterium]
MHYLLKTEPSEYSFEDLQKDRRTEWTGITNAAAVMNLRAMKGGDELIIYHTGGERRAVGAARVISADAKDPKKPVVVIEAGEPLPRPIVLDEIKRTKIFRDSALLRIGRLSVVPLSDAQYKFLLGK